MTHGRPRRRCSICSHAARAAIDALLVAGDRQRDLVARFNLSADALKLGIGWRMCGLPTPPLPRWLPATLPGERTAVDLLGSVATLQARLMALLRRAERSLRFENGSFGGS